MAKTDRAIEVAGEDVESAIAAGLTRLGVERDAVEIDVLDEGRQGVLGLGTRAARVRLRVTSPQAVEAPPEAPPEPAEAPPVAPPDSAPTEEPAPRQETASEEEEEEEKEKERPEATEEDKIRVVRGVVKDLLALLGIKGARIDVQRAEAGPNDSKVPPLEVDVRGQGTDALIGRDGETLNAFQTVTRLIVGREMQAWVHLVVDVQGYKAKRAEELRRKARRLADKAERMDRTVILEPMPPNERRVIHVALHDDSRVKTESIGEGDRRRVTIVPQDQQ